MSHRATHPVCAVCGQAPTAPGLTPAIQVRESIANLIRQKVPDWNEHSFICKTDLAVYRAAYVHTLLVSEKGELSSLEHEVVKSLKEHELLSRDVEADDEVGRSFGERLSDRIATFGGSWAFLISFGVFIALWIVMNAMAMVLFFRPFDPYPFILLNLLLSCLAAVQAPVILMSQNRQEIKDRLRSQHDYQVNLKAELEIRHLHEKLDHLLSHQWARLVEIQEVQMEVLAELNSRKN